MRVTFTLSVIIVAMACSCFCRAQSCTTGLDATIYHCAYGSCRSQIGVWTPEDDFGDQEYTCTYDLCCGQYFTTCSINGYCSGARKAGMTPTVRKYLEKLPFNAELLVADCNGHYALFKPASPNLNTSATVAIVNDRVLR